MSETKKTEQVKTLQEYLDARKEKFTEEELEMINLAKSFIDDKDFDLRCIPVKDLVVTYDIMNKISSNSDFLSLAMSNVSLTMTNPVTKFTADSKKGKYDDVSDIDYNTLLDIARKQAALYKGKQSMPLDLYQEYRKILDGFKQAMDAINNILVFLAAMDDFSI